MSNTNTIEIISKHATLSEAVKAANIDLSYNQQAAESKIKDIECGFRGCKGGEAYVTNVGVFFIYKCDITLLNKFEPHHSVMDDTAFRSVTITDGYISFSAPIIPKTPASRKLIAKLGITVG
jgi:hypothetical protein